MARMGSGYGYFICGVFGVFGVKGSTGVRSIRLGEYRESDSEGERSNILAGCMYSFAYWYETNTRRTLDSRGGA